MTRNAKALVATTSGLLAVAPLGCIPTTPSPGADLVVNTRNDTVDINPGDGLCGDADGRCSLRAAIQEANARGGAQIIDLDPGETYVLGRAGAGEDAGANGDFDITGDIELRGYGARIDAAGLDRAFDVQSGAALTVYDLTVINGSVEAESGGGFRTAGTLSLYDVTVRDCSAAGDGASGGAIFNAGGDLFAMNATLTGNSATRAGGAIEADAGSTELDGGAMRNNMAGPTPGNGGGLHLTGAGTIDVNGSVIENNTATREGGGLWNSAGGTMTVTACTLTGNTASGDAADDGGGGLFNDGGTLTVTRSVINNNTAPGSAGSGGGIFNNGGTLTVMQSSVLANSATRAGGGVEANAGETSLRESSLNDNSTGASPGNGGGLHLTGEGSVDVYLCVVSGNTASAEGGGLWNSAGGTMMVEESDIMMNTASGADADQGGGGLFNDGGTMTVMRCVVSDNVADGTSGSGGGVLNNDGTCTIALSTISGNESQRAGGGVEANVGLTTLEQVDLLDNSTGPNPGNGGGVHLTGAGEVTLTRGAVLRNTAAAEGGGLWNSSTGTMTIEDSTIDDNEAPTGPEVFNDGGDMTIDGIPIL